MMEGVYRLSVLNASHERWILDTAAGVAQAGDGAVVTKALKLILHRLREHRAVDVGILWCLGCKLNVKVGGIQGVSLKRC